MARKKIGSTMSFVRAISPTSPTTIAAPVLSMAQLEYLRDRALRFQQTVGDAMGLPFGGIVDEPEGPDVVAELAASSLFGDDNNIATGQPSPEWRGPEMWAEAFYFVRDNLAAWLKGDAASNPTALAPVLGPTGTPVRAAQVGTAILRAPSVAPVAAHGHGVVKSCDPDTGWCQT